MTDLSEPQIMAALRARYAAPAWALLSQVRNQTGYARTTRTADAIAMSLYPSRGLELHGFEIKVSRSDFTRELKDPDKADEIARFCDRWWIVVGNADIVRPGELPPTWGLLVPRGKALVVKAEATKLDAAPITRPFLAAVLRNVAEGMVPASAVGELAGSRIAEARLAGEQSRAYATAQVQKELDELRANVSAFEANAGISIGRRWDAADIGKAVRFVREGGMDKAQRALPDVADSLRRSLAFVESVMQSTPSERA